MIVNLEQGSTEWLQYRRSKIGGSDAPIIMGVSPYKTVKVLFEEKVQGISQTQEHFGMKRGKELEPLVLAIINEEIKANFAPAVIQNDSYPFLIASLDGYDSSKNVACEIKCPNSTDHALAVKGKVPAHYFPQLQHIMFVCNLGEMLYVSYSDYADQKLAYVTVKADKEYQEEMLEKEKIFYKSLCMELLDDSFNLVSHRPEIDVLYHSYKDIKEEIKKLEDKAEKLKDAIVALCEEKNVTTNDVAITKHTRVSCDYDKICKEYDIDKDLYSKTSTYWSIKERK